MPEDKIKRALTWLRRALTITDKTTLPGTIDGQIRPTLDAFGWSRLEEGGPQSLNANGADAAVSVLLPAVPAGVQRLVLRASYSINDPVFSGTLALEIRSGGLDISISEARVEAAIAPGIEPVRHGLERNILLLPGEIMLAVSDPAPAVGSRLNVRYNFVDLPIGEYLQSIS